MVITNYKWIPTTSEVWSSIKNFHNDELIVFGSYSAPGGDMFADPSICIMQTEYGFKGADVPLLKAKTTWDRTAETYERINEQHQYWIALVYEEEE